jgi:hypothetical protein
MMDSKQEIESVPKVGSILVYMDFPKIQKENSW